MNRRWRSTENLRSAFDRDKFALRDSGFGFEARDLPIAAQIADVSSGEPFTGCSFTSLTIENTSDDIVWVKRCKACEKFDRIFIRADSSVNAARNQYGEWRDGAAFPIAFESAFGAVFVRRRSSLRQA